MSDILDRVFPESDGEWIGAEIYAKSAQRFKDFEDLQINFGHSEISAALIALSDVSDWSEDIRKKLRNY